MAGTLTISTLSDGTNSTSATNPILGSAKAWVNFNGTLSSPITPRASYNVTSVTKIGTGDYTITFTNAFADTNYCPVAMTSGDADIIVVGASRTVYAISSTSSCPVRNYRTVDNSLQDQATMCVGFFR